MQANSLSLRQLFTILFLAFVLLFGISAVTAWTGPTASPPNNNVAAPINVGTTDQVKNGGVGVDALAVYGNTLFGAADGSNAYTNYGGTSGDSGYGFRDDNGTMEYKDSGGNWVGFGSGSSSSSSTGSLDISGFFNRTWNDVTSGRSPGTTYQNTYDYPIDVSTYCYDPNGGCQMALNAGAASGNLMPIQQETATVGAGTVLDVYATIPPDWFYQVTINYNTPATSHFEWYELY